MSRVSKNCRIKDKPSDLKLQKEKIKRMGKKKTTYKEKNPESGQRKNRMCTHKLKDENQCSLVKPENNKTI